VGISRLFTVAILVAITVMGGALGFMILGDESWSFLDALYMAVITLSTVGFSEVHPLTEAQRIWTILIISFGIGIVLYAFSQAAQFILNFDLLRRRRMEYKASQLRNHFIVCGFGRMGKVICSELSSQNLPFVIIDSNSDKINNIREAGLTYVQGDATMDETLKKANLKDAKGLVVVLSSDSDNLFVTMSARTMNPELFITSRCSVDSNTVKLKRAGADKVVNPYIAGGHKMADLLVEPALEDSVELMTPKENLDLAIEEIKVSALKGFSGKSIRNAGLREEYGLLIAGVIEESGEVIISPGPDIMLENNQILMLMGEKEKLKSLKV
jgi:voltage-gated potassium channel